MLSLQSINCYYGGIHVLRDVSLDVGGGEIVALLGRNGAGKTTTLNAVMGLVKAKSGSIVVDGVDLTARPAHEIPGLGVAYVPQGRRLFPEMSVEENLTMGLLVRGGGSDILDRVLELFPVLRERLDQRAGTLSGGEQQMLATGRALCLEPKVLLLDEPSEGLMARINNQILETISGLKDHGVAVLLVEQKVEAALKVADRIAFIENGSIVHQATPGELASDPEPLHKYVGISR